VNDSGRSKIAGTGQRIVKGGFLFSAVVMVHSPDPVREALTAAYHILGLPFDPASVGCVADSVSGVSTAQVRSRLIESIADVLDLGLPSGSHGAMPQTVA
jgi:lipoate-protein ligase A